MSTEYDVLRDAKQLRDRLIKEANKPLDIRIVGALGRLIELQEDARGQVTPDLPSEEAIAEAISVELAKRTNWEDNGSAGLTPGTDIRLAAAILALFNEKGNE